MLFLSPCKVQKCYIYFSSTLVGVRGNVLSGCCQNVFEMVIREECYFFSANPFPPPQDICRICTVCFLCAYFSELSFEVQYPPVANVVACSWIHRKVIFHQLQLNVLFLNSVSLLSLTKMRRSVGIAVSSNSSCLC